MSKVSRRVGVIGLGMASAPHAQSLIDLAGRVEVAGCFSPSAERRAAFAARHSLPVVDRLEALLEDPALSAVLLLTPPDTHAELVARCAAAGKHVLLEKPLDATPEGARAVVSAMEAAGLTLGVMLQHRFRASVERLAGLMRHGALGRPLTAAVSVRWWRDAAYYAQPGRGKRARDGGGVLLTQAIHTLDAFVSLLGLPDRVAGFAATSVLRKSDMDTEDVVAMALRYGNGMLATVNATTAVYPGYPERIEIAGSDGSAVLAGDRLEVQLVNGERITAGADGATLGGGADPMAFSHQHHRAVLSDFLDALDEGRRPRVDGREALKVHRLIEAMLEASGSGGSVEVGTS
ncbi:Gfo/Idh/MocA family oxidoreductase (plasmid) [Azospirillum oryzae]|uniref:Gfo/Idh/MocA family oxidoreductase n=2 Tax=Azospirillum oryzae TaxID=286727 RepID=A0A6N1AFL2_9PROT|nr:Gfo/Idh/MocA family oxidoreductase [Azospirillum oryzae]KAA0585672.1 Gfo/Idh/MocA family oxidoreductase [Azospirillum oryzae]QKS50326.1 Gfo/Idh/MocA family oxidoreductase [Azospirillum oryzae]